MISINYQTYGAKGFNLRLRMYQGGETKFINVNRMLKGNLQKKHWNAKKQQFVPSAPYCDENNDILVKFRHIYDERALGWSGTLSGFIASFEESEDTKVITVDSLISYIVDEMKKHKHTDGTTKGSYENYEKLRKRLEEFSQYKKISYEKLCVKDIDAKFVHVLFKWVETNRKNRGIGYISATLHSVLNKADSKGWYDMSALKDVEWYNNHKAATAKYETLTVKQCNKLMEMDLSELPKNPKSNLYRDFCIFLLYTGQSPCDAITLTYSDITTIDGCDYFVFNRRKIAHKQRVPCTVPINARMKAIMSKWRRHSKDGYVFPIRNKAKLKTQRTNNGDIKHFNGRLNNWLKKVGKLLGCKFPLHTYIFRHTAITNYLSKGVPVVYVSNLTGTSIENIEKIYYNNQADIASRNKVLDIRF